MTETKFTPGPWEAHDGQIWETYPDIDDQWRFKKVLADIRHNTGWPKHQKIEGSEANAHLIAAAPELYAALEWYAEQSRLARSIYSEGDEGRHALASDGGEKALAALAKARGETA